MKKMFLCLCGVVGFSLVLLSCENGTEPEDYMPDNGKNIQVVYPKGGESFIVGDTVIISVKINADKVASVSPSISKDDGKNYDDITSKSIDAKEGGGGQLLTCQWVIGQEVIPVSYDSTITTCKIKVHNYLDTAEKDQSGVFTINP